MFFDSHYILFSSNNPICSGIVGISFYTNNRVLAYNLSIQVRKALPKAVIVMGGHHASYLYEQLIEKKYADVVVIGEGEQTFYELVTCLTSRQPLDQVAGLAFKNDDKTVVTSKRSFIKNLDSLLQ